MKLDAPPGSPHRWGEPDRVIERALTVAAGCRLAVAASGIVALWALISLPRGGAFVAAFSILAGAVAVWFVRRNLLEARRELAILRRRATTDSLTGLLNRGATVAAVQRLIASDWTVVVAAIDLDRFKMINDQFGHDAGDQVLRHVAQTLRAQAGPHDVVGRFGGDEFVWVLPSFDLAQSLRRIEHAIGTIGNGGASSPLPFEGGSATAGVAASGCRDVSIDHLLRQADLELLAAKATAPGTVRWPVDLLS